MLRKLKSGGVCIKCDRNTVGQKCYPLVVTVYTRIMQLIVGGLS